MAPTMPRGRMTDYGLEFESVKSFCVVEFTSPVAPKDIHGVKAFSTYMRANAAGAFTEMHLEIHETIAVDNKVVLRFTNSGTQTGPFMGTPASGNSAHWPGIGIYTVERGRITEAWFGEDILGMMLQLGTIKLPTS